MINVKRFPVSVLGTYDRGAGVFRAEEATTQCPSIYNSTDAERKALTSGETKTYQPAPASPEKAP